MNINLTAYINQLGYGIVGLNILKALSKADVDVALWVNGPGEATLDDQSLILKCIQNQNRFDPNSPSLRIAHQWDMAPSIGRGLRTGLTFFELDYLNEAERHHLSSLDKLFVPSHWAGEVLLKNKVPEQIIEYAPLGVDTSIFNKNVKPALPKGWESVLDDAQKNNSTIFLSCGKWEVRKGHDILADAFKQAFEPNDNVILFMNCNNPFIDEDNERMWWEFYQNRLGNKVWLVHSRLPAQQDVAKLMACADCGVFPARAEGWNMELAEMMAMGKNCIATNYSAHTEFCNQDNCLLIEPDGMEQAFDGVFFKGNNGEWADLGSKSFEQLVVHMRNIHKRKQEGSLTINQEGINTFSRLTWDNTVKEILGVL